MNRTCGTALLILALLGVSCFVFPLAPQTYAQEASVETAYRVGLVHEPDPSNPFALFGATGATLWNYAASSGYLPLAGPVGPRGDLLPILASTLTPQYRMKREQHPESGRTYVTATIPLRRDVSWSDGTPLSAYDVVFTYQSFERLKVRRLGGNWPILYPEELVYRVERLDNHTVKFWLIRQPGLGEWQYGLLAAPILQEAVWREAVDEAVLSNTPALTIAGRRLVSSVLGPLQPVVSASTITDSTVAPTQRSWELHPNPHDVRAFEKVVLFASGHAALTNPLTRFEYRTGGISGEVSGTIGAAPVPRPIALDAFRTRDEAAQSLWEGEIDALLDPLALRRSPDDVGVRTLAFNLKRRHLANPALRKALATLIDRGELANRLGAYDVVPERSIVPAPHTLWHNPAVGGGGIDLPLEERVKRARAMLTEARFTWDYGALMDPLGDRVGPLSILTPPPTYDPVAYGAATYVAQSLHRLGIETVMQLEELPEFLNQTMTKRSFDLAIIGTRLGSSTFPHQLGLLLGPPSSSSDQQHSTWSLTGYWSAELVLALRDLVRAPRVDVAQQAAFRIQELVERDAPLIPLLRTASPLTPIADVKPLRLEWLWSSLSPRHSTMWIE